MAATAEKLGLKPIGDKVVVKPSAEEERSSGGIYLPDAAKKRPQEGKVLAVGTGKRNDKGELTPLTVKEGDIVIYSKYGGTEITVNGEDLLILDEDNIYAIKE